MLIYVDSTNRDLKAFPQPNTYVLQLTETVKHVSKVDLVMAAVPNVLWNITSGSNCIAMSGLTLSVPPGFYSGVRLAELLTQLSAAIVVSYIEQEGKFLFTGEDPFTVHAFDPNVARILGITTDVLRSSLFSSDPVYSQPGYRLSGSFIKSTSIIDISLNELIFLDIEELRTPTLRDANGQARHFLGVIPLDTEAGTTKTFTELSGYKIGAVFPTAISLDRLTVAWRDKTGALVDFHGHDGHSFILRLTISPDAPPKMPMVKMPKRIDPPPPPPPPSKKRFSVMNWAAILIVLISGYFAYKKMFAVPVM